MGDDDDGEEEEEEDDDDQDEFEWEDDENDWVDPSENGVLGEPQASETGSAHRGCSSCCSAMEDDGHRE